MITLQCGRPCRVVGHRQMALWSFMVSGMVILLFVSAASGESSRPFMSQKQIEAEEYEEKGELKNWVSYFGESTWKAVSAQVIRLWSSEEEQNWPQLTFGVRTIAGILLGALAAAVASAAGLGGGLLFVPILKLVLQFDSKTSVAMATFMMFGATTAGMALNLMRDHPNEFNKSLVDFDIALLLQPNMLLGISIGVILNIMLPIWLITAFLVVTLVYMAYNTTKSGLKRWNTETELARAKRNQKKITLRRSNTASEKALTEHLLGFYRSVSSLHSVKAILALVFVWLTLFFLQILRGGFGRQGLLHVIQCGVSYWLLTASQIPVSFGVSAWNIWQLRSTSAASLEPGTSDNQEEGYTLGPKQGIFLSGMALLGGLVAGMLGSGGAVVINPLLLSVGVLPQVTTATTLFLMFFSSSMSAAEYWLMGRVPVGYSVIAALICAASSALGIVGLQKVVNKYGRPSLIVFLVAFVMGFCAIFMSVYGTIDVWQQYKSGADMGFSIPC
ncbi:unnamed protein product [Calypogeia fissa]